MNGYDLNFDQEGPVSIPTPQEANSDQQIAKPTLSKVSHDQSLGKVDSNIHGKNKKLKLSALDEKPKIENDSAKAGDVQRDNEIYTVNGKAFEYMNHPIPLQVGKPYRIYLVNMLEFDLVNSFHLHGALYNYTVAGTEETPNYMTDMVTLAQGDRGILEFKFDYPGEYMFHAHQAEFTDKGWMGLFNVKSNTAPSKDQNFT
jgi:FtsP/CotA-like multicopper oxidase with cupredoxin domain